MSPRQWHGLRRWLGEPEEFQDPKYDVIAARFAAWPKIGVLIAQLFADQTMKALVSAGQAHGVPISAVLDPAQILASEHFQAVGAIADAELVPGVHSRVPAGYFAVNGQHVGFAHAAPPAGHHDARWLRRAGGHRRPPGNPASVRSTGCASSTSASSSPAANSAACSAIWAPRSSRSKVRPIPTDCGRRGSATR